MLSMETIEHLEDYFTYVENAVSMMKAVRHIRGGHSEPHNDL